MSDPGSDPEGVGPSLAEGGVGEGATLPACGFGMGGAAAHTKTRSIPPSLASATYSGIQSSPRIRFAISTTM